MKHAIRTATGFFLGALASCLVLALSGCASPCCKKGQADAGVGSAPAAVSEQETAAVLSDSDGAVEAKDNLKVKQTRDSRKEIDRIESFLKVPESFPVKPAGQ